MKQHFGPWAYPPRKTQSRPDWPLILTVCAAVLCAGFVGHVATKAIAEAASIRAMNICEVC